MPKIKACEPRLSVSDLPRSLEFYCERLGFIYGAGFPDGAPTFALLTRDGAGLQLSQAAAGQVVGETTVWLDTEGVLDEHARLRESVTIEWGPEVYFYGRREFAVRDPDGHLIIFSEETDDPPTCAEE